MTSMAAGRQAMLTAGGVATLARRLEDPAERVRLAVHRTLAALSAAPGGKKKKEKKEKGKRKESERGEREVRL